MRLPWLWPTIIILSALATGLVTFVFPDTAVRSVIVLWFLFVCPGMMLVRFFRLGEIVAEWTLAFALSFAIDAIVTGILLYAARWSPTGALSLLMGLCLSGAIIQLTPTLAAIPNSLVVLQQAVTRLAIQSVSGLPHMLSSRKRSTSWPIVSRYPGLVAAKKQRYKTLRLGILLLLLLCLVGSGVSIIAYQTYKVNYTRYMSLAQMGAQHLKTAVTLLEALPKDPFDDHTISQAQLEFAAAAANFTQLNNELAPLSGISALIPGYGARLSTALHLLPLTIGVSQAGVTGCNILKLLISMFHDSLNAQGRDISMADLTTIDKEFDQIKASLNPVIEQAKHLQVSDLQFDPGLSKVFANFQKEIPLLQVGLDDAEKLLPVLPALLGIGAPANYLVEVLDSTELRPAGGVIGNYGIVTLSKGRLAAAQSRDVYLLDQPFEAAGQRTPYPATYASWFDLAPQSWSLRDSNLDADFPTSALNAQFNYLREGGTSPMQGVIAITPALIQHMLAITGPIDVPEYHEVVTAQNLIDRIHYYELGSGQGEAAVPSLSGNSAMGKQFTQVLATHFLARVRQLSPSDLPQLSHLMFNSLYSKDLQVFLNSSSAEQLLQRYHLDAAIQAPVGDSLFVVDANLSRNKANQFLLNTLDDRVTIDTEGNALHHTTITYTWKNSGEIYGSDLYRDYVRVYVPPGSTLAVQDGLQPFGTSQAFGREVWAGYFTLSYGQTRTITFTWTVPGAAKKDAYGWHYQYLIQRQAGAQRSLNQQIILPSCAVITHQSGGLLAHTGSVATLSRSLNEDWSIGMDYTC